MQLSVMGAASEVIVLWCCRLWRKQLVPCSVWCGLFNILSNSWSSASSNSWSKSSMSGGQKPHRLLRLITASTRWQSVAVMNPYVSRDTTTARKTACRPISVIPWCRSTRRTCTQRLCAVTDNSTDMFWRWQVVCYGNAEDFQHILAWYVLYSLHLLYVRAHDQRKRDEHPANNPHWV